VKILQPNKILNILREMARGGAKPERSTTSNIKALVNTIRKGLPDKQHFVLGLYGLEDAYYRVDILTLVDKMMNCGVVVR